MATKIRARTEPTTVMKLAVVFWGSRSVIAEAVLDDLSTFASVDTTGGSTVVVVKGNEHRLTSSVTRFCGLSQPKKKGRLSALSTTSNLSTQLTRVGPLLALTVDTARASIKRRTPTALELYLILQTRIACCEAVTCFERR